MKILERVGITSKVSKEFERPSIYGGEIKFSGIGSGVDFQCRSGFYDNRDILKNEIIFSVYGGSAVTYQANCNPLYEKQFDKNLDNVTKEEISKSHVEDKKKFKEIVNQVDSILTEANIKIEAILKKAGYSKED